MLLKNYKINLRHHEAHNVRAKCNFKDKCKWLCYGAIYKDCGKFMSKNYHPIHKCSPSNKNKMCTSKFLTSIFKDEVTKQQAFEDLGNTRIVQAGATTVCGQNNLLQGKYDDSQRDHE